VRFKQRRRLPLLLEVQLPSQVEGAQPDALRCTRVSTESMVVHGSFKGCSPFVRRSPATIADAPEPQLNGRAPKRGGLVGRGRLELPHPFGGDFTDPDHRFVFELAHAHRKRNGLKTVRAELETVGGSISRPRHCGSRSALRSASLRRRALPGAGEFPSPLLWRLAGTGLTPVDRLALRLGTPQYEPRHHIRGSVS